MTANQQIPTTKQEFLSSFPVDTKGELELEEIERYFTEELIDKPKEYQFFGLCTLAVFLAPFAIGGLLLNESSGLFSGISIAVSILVAWGFGITKQMEGYIVERFGKYYRTLHPGPRWLLMPGIVDKMSPPISRKLVKKGLYQSEGSDHVMDFTDASAGVQAQAWYRVKDLKRWYYSTKNPESRIEERFDALARPTLQQFSIDVAQQHKSEASLAMTEYLAPKLLKMVGVAVSNLLIVDIELPSEVTEQRLKVLTGEKTKAQEVLTAEGFGDAAVVMAQKLNISPEEAYEKYLRRKGLDALEKADLTMYGNNLEGLLRSLGITGGGDKK